MPERFVLRAYQQRAVDALMGAWRGVLRSPPGSGKTIMIAWALSQRVRLFDRRQRVLWLCNTIEQKGQALAALGHVPDLAGALCWVRCPSGIDGVPLERIDILIVDECHHAAAESWAEVIKRCPNTHTRWGMTANTHREDGLWEVVESLLGPIIHRVTNRELEEEKKLVGATVRFHSPESYMAINQIVKDKYTEEFHKNRGSIFYKVSQQGANLDIAKTLDTIDLINIMNGENDKFFDSIDPKRLPAFKKCIEALRREKSMIEYRHATKLGVYDAKERTIEACRRVFVECRNGSHVIMLVACIEQGKAAMTLLNQHGVDARMVFSKMTKRDHGCRKTFIEEFRAEKFPCLIATSLADEGLDVPAADCLVNASAGRGISKVPCPETGRQTVTQRIVQRPGRVLRAVEGKAEGRIHDFFDWHHPMLLNHSRQRARAYKMQGFTVLGVPDERAEKAKYEQRSRGEIELL